MGIGRIVISGMLLLLAHAASFAATDATDANVCNKYSDTKAHLSRIYDEYALLPKKPENAEKLFLLYRQLEQAAMEAQTLYPSDYNRNSEQYVVISECLWDSKFQEIGLSIGHYSDRLEYSKKLMAEAHQLNPHSKYRNYTLYTEIRGKGGADFFGFPDVDKAQSYLNEFPSGPYATKVNAILAGFYHDLYAALRTIEKEPNLEKRGVTYSCFDDYVAKHPEDAKQERARKLGILYFEKVIAATPLKDVNRPMYLGELDALKHGKTDNVVNVCGD